MESLPRPSRKKCGSRKLISKKASGHSFGMSISLQTLPAGGAHEHDEQLKRARDLPAAQVAGRGVAPHVRRERTACSRDFARDLENRRHFDAALARGELRRELAI